MKGNTLKCDLTPQEKNYSYQDTIKDLENKYGFLEIGEGSFGKILSAGNCVVKIIKDIKRCNELAKEKEVYQRITNDPRSNSFFAKFPKYHLYEELTDFCHFNMQKIHSPVSGYGNIYDDDSETGFGFVVTENENKVLMITNDGSKKLLNKEDVYAIDKPGNLIHFYINHFDVNLKEKLDNNQGILLGKSHLEKMFTPDVIKIYCQAIGELIAFLIFDLMVIPNDVEIVLGTDSSTNRIVIPYITDFNECDFIKEFNDGTLFRIGKALYNKNGRFYFPNRKNPYYSYFVNGFLKNYTEEKNKVLIIYDSLF
jgi:hypothetical protein